MRIVSRKLNAEVDRPVSIVVEESDGPEPQDLLFASQSEAGSSGSSESTASSDSTYANAGPEAREAAVAEQTERSYAVGLTAVAAVAWAAAVLAAAVAVSTAVDRATGLGIVVVGPWRRRSAERPVPRALKLRTKALLMGLLVPLLAVAGTIGIRLAAGQEQEQSPCLPALFRQGQPLSPRDFSPFAFNLSSCLSDVAHPAVHVTAGRQFKRPAQRNASLCSSMVKISR